MRIPVMTLLLATLVQPVAAQDRGVFHIYKLQNRIGQETFETVRRGDTVFLSTAAEWNFIGTPVRLTASLRSFTDGTPIHLSVNGAASTMNHVAIEMAAPSPAPAPATLSTHYPPLAIEEALIRRWHALNRRPSLGLWPTGIVRIRTRGHDTVAVENRLVILERLSVNGLIWGMQSVWIDDRQNLVAVVGADAELDRFEGIRDGFQAALSLFVRRAVDDVIADLSVGYAPARENNYALSVGLLVDGTDRPPIPDAMIVIQDGRIRAIGPRTEVRVPDGFEIRESPGLTAIPGLFDLHGHYEQAEWALAGLAAGVTTVRDAANEFELATALRDAIDRGRVPGPRMILAGYIDGGEHPLGSVNARTPEDVRDIVKRYHGAGYKQIKIYQSLAPALVPVVVEEAHKLGMTVTGHVPTGMNALAYVRAGADQINHLNFVTAVLRTPPQPVDLNSPAALAAIAEFVKRGTVLDPSLARGEQQRHPRSKPFSDYEPGARYAPVELQFSLNTVGLDDAVAERAMQAMNLSLTIVGELHKAGIPIVLGTDLVVPGHSIHRELELAVRAGLTSLQALQSATIVSARALGLEREAGTLVVGKRADLVLIEGNPLGHIGNVRNVRLVVANGRTFNPAPLWRSVGFQPAPGQMR